MLTKPGGRSLHLNTTNASGNLNSSVSVRSGVVGGNITVENVGSIDNVGSLFIYFADFFKM